MKKIAFPTWTIPPALLLLCLISYGLMIPRLGYYWDDWPAVWFTRFYGSASLVDVLGIDRPQLAWLYFLTTSLIGESRVGWQIFSLLMRWLSCLALWWTLLQIWPKNRGQVVWVVFLFAIYPGFRQQYIALIYSHDWIIISLFFLSLGLMVRAVRRPKWRLVLLGLSWLLAAYTMFADEYYFGLELLRPVLLWMALAEPAPDSPRLTNRQRLGKVFLYWLPYLVIMAAFLFWRLVVHVSPRGQIQVIDQIVSSPLIGLFNLAKTVLLDIFESGLVAWSLPFDFKGVIQSGVTSIYGYLLLALIVAGLVIFFLTFLEPGQKESPSAISQGEKERNSRLDQTWAIQAALLGLFALFIAGWPFWATAWQIGLTFPWDRFNLAMNLGACLLVTGLLILILRRKLFVIIALGVIIGLASASSFHLANQYRQDWDQLKSFFWQLTWRVPALEPGTLVLTSRPPFTYSTDNSLTAPLNWIYAPGNRSQDLPYLLYDVATHAPYGWEGHDPSQDFNLDYRITNFQGSYGRAISVISKPPNCVKVLDSEIDQDLPGRPLFITPAAAFSRTDLILPDPLDPASPPIEIFGPEPEHDWCYFFEKAELARQQKDWAKVSALADQALPLAPRLTQTNALEWMPFIEGYAHLNRWSDAEKLSLRVYEEHPKMRRMLCSVLKRVEASAPGTVSANQTAQSLWQTFNCSATDEE